jgi:hypothetical protein
MSETMEQAAATAGATLASLLIQGQQAQALIMAAQLGIADRRIQQIRRVTVRLGILGACQGVRLLLEY